MTERAVIAIDQDLAERVATLAHADRRTIRDAASVLVRWALSHTEEEIRAVLRQAPRTPRGRPRTKGDQRKSLISKPVRRGGHR